MNYYRRYIGDYGRDTALLSFIEHGAYGLLLDHYYASDGPLPADKEDIYRVARAVRPEERKAIDKVLSLYFVEKSTGFHNIRADEEIARATPAIAAARKNGGKGGRPRNPLGFVHTNPSGIPDYSLDSISDEPNGKAIRAGDPTTNHHPPTPNLQPPTSKKKTPMVAAPPSPEFVQAWKQYPKRIGNNPKADALKAWKARIREGVKPEAMLAGLARYAKFCQQTDKTGTELVMQAVRFFGKSRPFEQEFLVPDKQAKRILEWWESAPGIESKGEELGLQRTPGEIFPTFKERVFFAAGEGPWRNKR